MNELWQVVWALARVGLLLCGLGMILGGGLCVVFLSPSLGGHDAIARDLFWVGAVALVIGVALVVPVWRSIQRTRRESRPAPDGKD